MCELSEMSWDQADRLKELADQRGRAINDSDPFDPSSELLRGEVLLGEQGGDFGGVCIAWNAKKASLPIELVGTPVRKRWLPFSA